MLSTTDLWKAIILLWAIARFEEFSMKEEREAFENKREWIIWGLVVFAPEYLQGTGEGPLRTNDIVSHYPALPYPP